jgi:hypothetical protein
MDNETFYEKYASTLIFSFACFDGTMHDLVPGGKNIPVTYDNVFEFCDLVENFKLKEFDVQIESIKSGFSEVVPLNVIQLHSWDQLEILVVGNPIFDIGLWKKRTDSSGVSSKTSSLFWKVIESLTPKEQASFVRFAWGRSRLPVASEFNTNMRLTAASGSARLPVSHTCFFSVELPEYSCEAEMRHGILTAINFGVGGILLG